MGGDCGVIGTGNSKLRMLQLSRRETNVSPRGERKKVAYGVSLQIEVEEEGEKNLSAGREE